MICIAQVMKYSLRRERPTLRSDTTRLSDLRAKEVGTYAMPSADSAAAAIFCFLITVELKMPLVYILLPLVMLGRVYYQCHWVGDTLVGFLLGTFISFVVTNQFNAFVPFFRQIVGIDSFETL